MLIKSIQKYLIFASPVVLATLIWGSIQSDAEIRSHSPQAIRLLWEVMSWSVVLWFLLLFVFTILLAVRKQTQESAIQYLAGLKERDEREELIMGMAAKRAFTATSGFLIFLLFLSCFTLSVAKLPPHQVVDGKKSSLTLGFKLVGTDTKTTTSPDGQVIYEHKDLPLSKSAIILMILIWQVVTFRMQARKELRGAV